MPTHTPWTRRRLLRPALSAIAVATLLLGCGGGDDGGAPRIASVLSVGDSLSDSGTFGYKFTVQGQGANGKDFRVWSEYVAAQYNQTLCAHYRYTTLGFSTTASCHNYAIGGAQINPSLGTASPLSVLRQIEDVASNGLPAHSLLLVDGGANDAAALVLAAGQALAGHDAAWVALLQSRLSTQEINALPTQTPQEAMAAAGVRYMQSLAQALATHLQDHILTNISARVGILNLPPIAQTPRFTAALNAMDAEDAANARLLANAWVAAFNTALNDALGSHPRVAIVDFHQQMQQQISDPAAHGYTNVTTTACGQARVPDDDLADCTTATLAAHAPTGSDRNDWWQRYMFANSFHPTPYGHEQMGTLFVKTLRDHGW